MSPVCIASINGCTLSSKFFTSLYASHSSFLSRNDFTYKSDGNIINRSEKYGWGFEKLFSPPVLPFIFETVQSGSIAFTRATLGSAVLATERWLAGWLVSVTRQYCVKMAKSILKLFRSSGSPSTVVFSTPCAGTQFQGEPRHIPQTPQNWRE